MSQPRISPVQYHGPFLGLNTTLAPRELPPAFGTVCHNVLLHEGRIRPRPPWRNASNSTPPHRFPPGEHILSMFHWHRRERDLYPLLLVKTTSSFTNLAAGKLYNLTLTYGAMQLMTGLGPYPAQFIVVGNTCYVIDGGAKMVRVSGLGLQTTRIGILKPALGGVHVFPNGYTIPEGNVVFGWDHPSLDRSWYEWPGNGNGLSGSYSYAVTYYDSTTGRESNPVYSQTPIIVNDHVVRLLFNRDTPGGTFLAPRDAGIDTIRVYRRNNGLGQPFYRLIDPATGDPPPDPFASQQYLRDSQRDEEITASTVQAGPFAPSRNDPPPASRCAAWYKDRMFYSPLDEPGKLYYSEFGYPDHVAGDAFVNVTGDESDDINGLLEVGSQLFIGKTRSIHTLSGAILAPTNKDRALGILDSQLEVSPHVLFRTKADIGPMGGFGNNMVLAGTPGMIHFAADAGLFRFDGVNSQNLTAETVAETWRALIQRGSGFHTAARISFAVDPERRILYVCNGRPGTVVGAPILAFHYATGAFSTFSEYEDPAAWSNISAVASAVGDAPTTEETTTYQLRPASVLVSTFNANVWISTESPDDDLTATPWNYETGDLAVAPTMTKHFYFAKVLLKRAKRFWGSSPAMKVGYRLDGADQRGPEKTMVLVNSPVKRILPIRRRGDDVRLTFRGADTWRQGWSPEVGITGFELSVELAGQR